MLPLDDAKHPSMSEFSARLSTFSNGWLKSHTRADPEDFAIAGLYYIQKKDHVVCFYCGGGLKNWDFDDNPYHLHAKMYPSCSYIINKKGHRFVNKIAQASHQKPVFNRCNFGGTTVVMSRNSAGVSTEVVKKRQQHVDKTSESGVCSKQTHIYSKFVFGGNALVSNQPTVTQTTAGSSSSASLKQPKERKMCEVCQKHSCDTVFLPCGHSHYCLMCSSAMKKCPICKRDISNRVKIYVC